MTPLLSPGVFIALIVCLTIVYLGSLLHRFYVSKADDVIDTMVGDITLHSAAVESHGKRLDEVEASARAQNLIIKRLELAEAEIKKTNDRLTNMTLSKLR